MPTRPAPLIEELIEALDSGQLNRLGDPESGDLRGIQWSVAEATVKRKFRTTYTKASQWLCERITEPDSLLVGLRDSGSLIGPKGNDNRYTSVALPGWDTTEMLDLAFDGAGRFKPGHRAQGNTERLWVVPRAALEPILAGLKAYRAEKDAENKAKADVERETFYGRYGDAMAVIETWLSNLDESGIEPALRGHADRMRTSNYDRSRYFGKPGSLTIDLRGVEIDAFAELIEKTRKEGS